MSKVRREETGVKEVTKTGWGTVEEMYRLTERCRLCDGSGYFRALQCPDCDGVGRAEKSAPAQERKPE